MSSTRRAAADADFSEERFCSSPEFDHALNAIAVAKRVQLIRETELRNLVWFLQWRSLEPNGLQNVADDVLSAFADRIGTAQMHSLGKEPGRVYSSSEVRKIRGDFGTWGESMRLRGEEREEDFLGIRRVRQYREDTEPNGYPDSYPVSAFMDEIEPETRKLVDHLKRVCLDPEASFTAPAARRFSQVGSSANLWWFRDLPGALLIYREACIKRASQTLVATEISRAIVEPFDFCLRQRRMVLIEGNPGLGKSMTARTWCAMQGGLARYLETPAGNDDRSFYARIADALGVANGTSYNGQQIKLRIERALKISGLMLVFDESSRLWPHFVRPKGLPSRMLWVMSMFDAGTPIALTGFQFGVWRKVYLEKTAWPDEQFERRLNRAVTLPPAHSEGDLFRIASRILPNGDSKTHVALVGVARLLPKKGASAMVELIATAKDICEQEGLEDVTFGILARAIRANHPEMQGFGMPDRKPTGEATSRTRRDTGITVQERAGNRLAPRDQAGDHEWSLPEEVEA